MPVNANAITAAEIKDRLRCGMFGCACRTKGNSHCPVPTHRDSSPSLSVKEGDRAGVVVYCHAGCDQQDVIDALRQRGLWGSEPMTPPRTPTWSLVREWAYPNDGSAPVAYHGREEDGQGHKRVRWRLPEGSYADGLKGLKLSDLPLYNAHLLEERPSEPAHLVEGEVAADEGTSRGLLAISLCGGAAQQDFGQALEVLAGRSVSLLPDNDEPGRTLMDRVGRAIAATAADLRLVELPDLPEKGDLVDWFRAGGTVEQLAALVAGAPRWAPLARGDAFHALSVDEWLAIADDPLDVVIGDGAAGAVLPIDGKGLISGAPGVGKTNLLLSLGRCLAEGSTFLGLPIPQPRQVLYLALEGSKRGLRKRMAKIWDGVPTDVRSRFHLAHLQLNVGDEVLIIDPLRDAHSGDENSSQDVKALTEVLDGIIARHHCALLAAHHERKRSPLARREPIGTDRVRGSTALTGWFSFCLSIETSPREADKLLAEWTKVRDAEEALPMLEIAFLRETLEFVATVRKGSGRVLKNQDIVDALEQNGEMRISELLAVLFEATGAGDRTVRERLRALVESGGLARFKVMGDRAYWYRLGDREISEEDDDGDA
jgi:hypothetical protein